MRFRLISLAALAIAVIALTLTLSLRHAGDAPAAARPVARLSPDRSGLDALPRRLRLTGGHPVRRGMI